ncbi:sigma-70 family RNA polymerase sigma factor [Pseudomonas sp. LRF_L74]|uniref:sigma-70 family RNA polymerase sigma factor n=1 Tax=Pseudomonas sp. LRF_L74 TaxID=3369422 RepID=UPI003F5D5A8F
MSDVATLHKHAVGLLFRDHYHWLCSRMRRYAQCAASAEDISAETFAQILQATPGTPIREPRALLTTIAKRLLYQLQRRRDLERAYLQTLAQEAEELSLSTEHLAQLVEALERIDRLLERLPAKVKATFLLSMVDGISYAEIATTLGISLSSVKVYMERALQQCYRVGLA